MAADPLSPPTTAGALDLSAGSVASFGTFRASLPRGKRERARGDGRAGERGRDGESNKPNDKGKGKGKETADMGRAGARGTGQLDEEEDEDVDVDGVEDVDASVLWQRRFQQSARAAAELDVGGGAETDAVDVDVVEVGDVTGALWADGGIGKLTHAQLLDLLRAKFGRLAHELDAAAATRLAPRTAAILHDDDDGQSQEGWGRDHDKENDCTLCPEPRPPMHRVCPSRLTEPLLCTDPAVSVEVGRIAHAPSGFVPWTEHTPGKRAVLAELVADPAAALDGRGLMGDGTRKPHI